MRKVITILLAFLLFILLAVIGNLLLINLGITGKSVNADFDYQHTKAICDGNTCRDYIVKCKNGNPIELTPISGLVTFDENWEDFRENKNLC